MIRRNQTPRSAASCQLSERGRMPVRDVRRLLEDRAIYRAVREQKSLPNRVCERGSGARFRLGGLVTGAALLARAHAAGAVLTMANGRVVVDAHPAWRRTCSQTSGCTRPICGLS
jgi:hypothetical protein